MTLVIISVIISVVISTISFFLHSLRCYIRYIYYTHYIRCYIHYIHYIHYIPMMNLVIYYHAIMIFHMFCYMYPLLYYDTSNISYPWIIYIIDHDGLYIHILWYKYHDPWYINISYSIICIHILFYNPYNIIHTIHITNNSIICIH